jgi:hypothetical protein
LTAGYPRTSRGEAVVCEGLIVHLAPPVKKALVGTISAPTFTHV